MRRLPRPSDTDLHDELSRVGAGHGAALSGGQDAHRPDVEARHAELAAQEDAALEQVRVHQLCVVLTAAETSGGQKWSEAVRGQRRSEVVRGG